MQNLSNIKDCENYEFIIFKRNVFKNQLEKALDIVKKYIIDNKLIITGGMAIDLALRKKRSSLYNELTLPDYDFYSSDYHNDAYKIGEMLCKLNLGSVDVIKASHPTTMRVRLNFEPVADLTYIPKEIYNKIPTLKFNDGRIFEHPHYKMINMHRALCYPYENYPREVILNRFEKDMKRYDLLYSFYPIQKYSDKIKISKISIPIDILEGECLTEFSALHYWNLRKQNIHIDIQNDTLQINDQNIIFTVPIFDSRTCFITILSDDPILLENKILKKYDKKFCTITYYNEFLDYIPAKICICVKIPKKKTIYYRIMDNRGNLTSAIKTKIGNKNLYVVNLQFLMQQFLLEFIFNETKENKIIYVNLYNQCFELVKEASDKSPKYENFKDFLPSENVFGKYNINKSDVSRRIAFLSYIGDIKIPKIRSNPVNIYLNYKEGCKIDKRVKNFDIKKSWMFNIDGKQRGDLPISIKERFID